MLRPLFGLRAASTLTSKQIMRAAILRESAKYTQPMVRKFHANKELQQQQQQQQKAPFLPPQPTTVGAGLDEKIKSESFSTKDGSPVTDVHGLPAELVITTRDAVKGRRITQELGVVVGTSARSRSILHDLWARVIGIFGGEIWGYKELFANTAAEATSHAMEEARALGATSIIRLRYEIASTENRLTGVSCFVICYGTAVRCALKAERLDVHEAIEASRDRY
eukprot:comp23800_c1_seq1/m.41380 comp23800_c1_seq1/g.41380  ORF comp23800_c1_seq1/g.41380 comp23800_c1_seq1/m.41380 type:complete len:223 (-) comp23800_c1_seq1:489-1157(-)